MLLRYVYRSESHTPFLRNNIFFCDTPIFTPLMVALLVLLCSYLPFYIRFPSYFFFLLFSLCIFSFFLSPLLLLFTITVFSFCSYLPFVVALASPFLPLFLPCETQPYPINLCPLQCSCSCPFSQWGVFDWSIS